MDAKFEIVDSDGDPIQVAHFVEGKTLPVKLISMRVEEGQMILTLEYLHGSCPCGQVVIVNGYRGYCDGIVELDSCTKARYHY